MSWLASDIAERNPYTSDFVLNVCRIVALIKAVRAGGRHLVVVDERQLGRAIALCCRRAMVTVFWRDRWLSRVRSIQAGLRNHLMYLRRWTHERRALLRHWCELGSSKDSDLLLLSWFDGTGMTGNDVTKTDRFLGQLPGWLRNAGFRPAWLVNPITSVCSIEEIAAEVERKAAFQPMIVMGALVGFRTLLRAYWRLLMMPLAVRRRFKVAMVDLSPLTRWALARELMSPRLVQAAVYCDLARALKRRGMRPTALIYPFENQPWEKAMLAGFRRDLPQTVLFGVHHAPFDRNLIGCHPSRGQWKDGTVPDVLCAIGEEFRDRLIASGAPPSRVVVGGALRYPSIRVMEQTRISRETNEPLQVFAACSMDFDEAFELSFKAIVATAGISQMRLLLGLHPMVSSDFRRRIRERVGMLLGCHHAEFVEGGVAKWLPKFDILVYDSSSAVFEAVACGIPAVHVGSECGLDLDVMSGRGVLKCRSAMDLRAQIRRLLDDHELRRVCIADARAYLQCNFSEPQADAWINWISKIVGGRRRSIGIAQ